MNSVVLRTHDVYDFNFLPNPLEVGDQPVTARNNFEEHYHADAGLLQFNNIAFPHMHVVRLRRTTTRAVSLINDCPVDTVNFNFQLTGYNNIQYFGLNHHLNSTAGTHYMVYNPAEGYVGGVESPSDMEILFVSLEKGFLMSLISCEDEFSERLYRSLDLEQPFSGADRAVEITPSMWHLISELKEERIADPLRKLYIQSKVLELITLQFDQFRTPSVPTNMIRPEDVDKLYYLKKYLDSHCLSDLSLTMLSRECLLNEFKVKSGFKHLFGFSVFGYLRKLRMEHASNLLRNSSLTIDEVADLLGYEHSQHFSTAFRKYMGESPSSHRRRSSPLYDWV